MNQIPVSIPSIMEVFAYLCRIVSVKIIFVYNGLSNLYLVFGGLKVGVNIFRHIKSRLSHGNLV